jgi:hypothetical protein
MNLWYNRREAVISSQTNDVLIYFVDKIKLSGIAELAKEFTNYQYLMHDDDLNVYERIEALKAFLNIEKELWNMIKKI